MTSSMQKIFDGLVLRVVRVLRGNDDVGDFDWLVVRVANGNLGLGVRAQPFHFAALANPGEFTAQQMRVHDRRGHELGRFITGITEHQTLVACALFGSVFAFRRAGINALRDVRRLRSNRINYEDFVRMEHVVVVGIADVANRFARDGIEIEFRLGGNFTTDNHEVGLGVGFARDTAVLVLRKAGIQHVIGNSIAHFVRMAFANGFGREDKVFAHLIKRIDVSGFDDIS